jgi:hypothetical protein
MFTCSIAFNSLKIEEILINAIFLKKLIIPSCDVNHLSNENED